MVLASFRVRFPEFRSAEDALVNAVLAASALELDADVFGTKYDEAHGYLAAHRLAVSPFGRSAKMLLNDGTTTYLAEYDRIMRICAQTVIVT